MPSDQTAEAPKLTEEVVLGLLRDRHHNPGNGGSGEWAFCTQVSIGARRVDALAMHLWHSRGFALHAYEVKVSRSDWLREVKVPAKADEVCQHADYFHVVAPARCVRDDELPDGWGLIEVHGDGVERPWKLRAKAKPAKLHRGQTRDRALDRGLVAAMARSIPGAVPGGREPGPLGAAELAGFERGLVAGRAQGETEARRRLEDGAAVAETARNDLRHLTEALTKAGLNEHQAHPWALARQAEVIATAVLGAEGVVQVDRARRQLTRALDALGGPINDDV